MTTQSKSSKAWTCQHNILYNIKALSSKVIKGIITPVPITSLPLITLCPCNSHMYPPSRLIRMWITILIFSDSRTELKKNVMKHNCIRFYSLLTAKREQRCISPQQHATKAKKCMLVLSSSGNEEYRRLLENLHLSSYP